MDNFMSVPISSKLLIQTRLRMTCAVKSVYTFKWIHWRCCLNEQNNISFHNQAKKKKHNIREEDKRVTLNGCQNYRSQSQQSIFYKKDLVFFWGRYYVSLADLYQALWRVFNMALLVNNIPTGCITIVTSTIGTSSSLKGEGLWDHPVHGKWTTSFTKHLVTLVQRMLYL